MPYIINRRPHKLPDPWQPKDEAEELMLADLEQRAHLKTGSRDRDLKPLSLKERQAYRIIKEAQKYSQPPMWNGHVFEFAAYGKQGCLLEVADNVANHLTVSWPKAITYVDSEADIPPGVTPIRRLTTSIGASPFGPSGIARVEAAGTKGDIVRSAEETTVVGGVIGA